MQNFKLQLSVQSNYSTDETLIYFVVVSLQRKYYLFS